MTKHIYNGPQDVPQYERTRMYSTERDALMELAMINNLAVSAMEALENRSKRMKRAKSIMGIVRWGSEWLLMNFLATVPGEQLESFKRNLQCMRYTLGVKGPMKEGHKDEWGLWVSYKDLDALAEAAQSQCLTCELKGGQERKCPLRKALDNVGTDIGKKSETGCGYRWLV